MDLMKKTSVGTIGSYTYGKPNDGLCVFIKVDNGGKKMDRTDLVYLDVIDGKMVLYIQKTAVDDLGLEIVYDE